MNLKILYEVGYFNIDMTIYLALVITIVLGYLLLIKKIKFRNNPLKEIGLWAIFVFLILYVTTGVLARCNYVQLLHSGRYTVTEGVVYNKVSIQAANYFRVGNMSFEYKYFDISSGYSRACTINNIFENGDHVRITHSGYNILKVEVERND